jgi:hypoxanthine phosphoribosyltransferase
VSSAHLYVDWEQYHRMIERLALQVHDSGYRFDSLLCLARGGLRVGDVISRVFDVPLAILATSSYRAAAGTEQGTLDIAEYITTTGGGLRGNLLLVDDLVDSGATLARVVEHLRRRYPALRELRTAVLWYKAVSAAKPDYFVQYLPDSPWIHQPFEVYDAMGPAKLAARLRAEAGGRQQDERPAA